MESKNLFYIALQDFNRARRMATVQEILGKLTGQSTELFSYEDVRRGLRATESANRILKEIPLKAIVGSVGRYTDFTRNFLPRKSIDQQRWARVKAQTYSRFGLDPIEVYQIGEAYFVQDGNHRVSIAKQSGSNFIQAYVREVKTEVPFGPDDQPDSLILKIEYAEFLATTQINRILPRSEIKVTEPGRYISILQQIDAVRFSRELATREEVPYSEAVILWYKEIYLPIIEIIRDQHLLEGFPGRTETDLFLWILKYRNDLEKAAGWQVQTPTAVSEMSNRLGNKKTESLDQRFKHFFERILPSRFKPPSKAGFWRQRRLAALEGRLFADILVIACDGNEICETLELALQIAWLEGSRVHGLLCSGHDQAITPDQNQIAADFMDQCDAVKITGDIIFEVGKITHILQNRIRLVDLVVLPVSLLLPTSSSKSIVPDFRQILRRSVAPILVAQGIPKPFKQVLLAYDGSPKSEQALYLAAFMTTFWEVSLDVLSIIAGKQTKPNIIEKARDFLNQYGVNANLIQKTGSVAATIQKQIEDSNSDLLIMGGYDTWGIKDAVSEKLLDQILMGCEIPVLICN